MKDEKVATLRERWRRIGHDTYDRVIDDPGSNRVFLVIDALRVEALDRKSGEVIWRYTCPKKTTICFPTCTVTASGLTFLLWGLRQVNSTNWIILDPITGEVSQFAEPKLVSEDEPIYGLKMHNGLMLVHCQGKDFWLGSPGNFRNVRETITTVDFYEWAGENLLLGKFLQDNQGIEIAVEFDFKDLENSTVTRFFPKEIGLRSMRFLAHSRDYYLFKPLPYDDSLPIFDKSGKFMSYMPACDENVYNALSSNEIGTDFIVSTGGGGDSFSVRRFEVRSEQYIWTKNFDIYPRSGNPKIYLIGNGLLVERGVKSKGPNRAEIRIDYLDLQTGTAIPFKTDARFSVFWPMGGNELMWTDRNLDKTGNFVSGKLVIE